MELTEYRAYGQVTASDYTFQEVSPATIESEEV